MVSELKIRMLAPAKINLGLTVLGKRADGYHEIRTLFQTVNIFDELEIAWGKKELEFICEGEVIPPSDQENIVCRAARLFLSRLKVNHGLRLLLKKSIPVAAGLGGGSSDAAATLRGLNMLFSYPFSEEILREMGQELGADVPFFLFGNAARGEGIGERLFPVTPLRKVWLLIINPGFSLATKWVYSNITTDLLLTKMPDHINMLELFLDKNDLSQVGRYLYNDLELVVADKYPVIVEIKERLLSAGALGAAMSGSGASVFGIFSDLLSAQEGFESITKEGRGWKIFLTRPYEDNFHQ